MRQDVRRERQAPREPREEGVRAPALPGGRGAAGNRAACRGQPQLRDELGAGGGGGQGARPCERVGGAVGRGGRAVDLRR